jgi:hypothetical protein
MERVAGKRQKSKRLQGGIISKTAAESRTQNFESGYNEPLPGLQPEPRSGGDTSTRNACSSSRFLAKRQPILCKLKHMDIQDLIDRFYTWAYQNYTLGSPKIDHLLTLIQFNVFRALISNTFTMGFTTEWLNGDAISPFSMASPTQLLDTACPLSLRPTILQRTILHHPWFDLFPIPGMRDNILRAGDSFDEDELCVDLVEFCDVPNEKSGLIV